MSSLPRKLILPLFTCALAALPAHAARAGDPGAVQAEASATAGGRFNLILAGNSGPNEIHISLSPDGRAYVVESSLVLEVGGDVCANPPEDPDKLECEATAINSFSFNGGAGSDVVAVARNVSAPATLRGGAGNDTLVGGSGSDRLMGGPGNDTLIGRGGNDVIHGGPGEDRLIGGRGEDTCIGGPGRDTARSCEAFAWHRHP